MGSSRALSTAHTLRLDTGKGAASASPALFTIISPCSTSQKVAISSQCWRLKRVKLAPSTL